MTIERKDNRKSQKHGNNGSRDFCQMPWFTAIFLMISKINYFFQEIQVMRNALSVSSPQRHNLTDENLALQVMMVVNTKNDFELVC